MITIAGKGKYADWITEDGLLQIQMWARDGLTEEQIAHNMGVSTTTFNNWKKRFPSIVEYLKKGKAPVDLMVENSLLRSALGYDYEEITYEAGKLTKRVKKHMPPVTAAQIFWLKNRMPGRWKEKIEAAVSENSELLKSLAALEKQERELREKGVIKP